VDWPVASSRSIAPRAALRPSGIELSEQLQKADPLPRFVAEAGAAGESRG
jgi:hypothetical protein